MDLRAIREKVKKREQQIRQMEDTIRAKREVIEKPQADQQDVHEKLDAKKKAIDRLTTSLRARESKRDSSATQQGKLQEEARSINHEIDDLNNKYVSILNGLTITGINGCQMSSFARDKKHSGWIHQFNMRLSGSSNTVLTSNQRFSSHR